jgi:hypothetical protein
MTKDTDSGTAANPYAANRWIDREEGDSHSILALDEEVLRLATSTGRVHIAAGVTP